MPIILSLTFLAAAIWTALKVTAIEQQKADDAAYLEMARRRVLGHDRCWMHWEGR